MLLGASYMQRIVYALNDCFPGLPIFNATKFLSPRNYPSDDSDQIYEKIPKNVAQKMLLKIQYIEEESGMCRENS